MARYRSYVICTSPRSGSTLLCKLLTATGVAGRPESYFHDPSIADWLSYYDLDASDCADKREVLVRIISAAIEISTANTGMFGLRLQRHSFDFFTEQLSILHPDLENDRARLEAAFGETLFVHLTREDKLEQAISYVKASQTGLWHMAPDGTELERLSAPQEPTYDADAIAEQLAVLTSFDEAWRDWFETERIEPLRIAYDELCTAPEATLMHILDRLGLDPEAAKGISPGVAKLADATNRRWRERFVAERGESFVPQG